MPHFKNKKTSFFITNKKYFMLSWATFILSKYSKNSNILKYFVCKITFFLF